MAAAHVVEVCESCSRGQWCFAAAVAEICVAVSVGQWLSSGGVGSVSDGGDVAGPWWGGLSLRMVAGEHLPLRVAADTEHGGHGGSGGRAAVGTHAPCIYARQLRSWNTSSPLVHVAVQ